MYTIYKRTTPDGKVYIGKTTQTLEKRAVGNGNGYKNNEAFYAAIQEFGWKNVESVILATTDSEEESVMLESKYIKLYESTNPEKGYNKSLGNYYTEKPKTFGQKVRFYRTKRGLSISELSKLTGLSESAIKLYECGERKHPIPVAKMALASAFKVKPSELDDDREENDVNE